MRSSDTPSGEILTRHRIEEKPDPPDHDKIIDFGSPGDDDQDS
ncbi:MAG TPA: hypothetical protein QF694_03585 [Dehalococcoidia bacterium]|nr:hypothetical protein [Dehalococcoidia bacterium]HJP27875.1 hypothetical protein [Dehalococcoidia bacterium]